MKYCNIIHRKPEFEIRRTDAVVVDNTTSPLSFKLNFHNTDKYNKVKEWPAISYPPKL